MQDILTAAMGLDVYREIIVACLIKGQIGLEPETEIRTFSTLIPEMQKLRDWVLETDCRNVAMESTGIYWQPIYEMLEPCFDSEISILVVNARHMKNVPGRKTDMRDAEWIATLLRAGLLKGSFIPEKPIRELRHLTRYRKSVVHDITAQKNRIDKFLQSSGFRFTAFLSDAFGASGRNIIRHLIENGSIMITQKHLTERIEAQPVPFRILTAPLFPLFFTLKRSAVHTKITSVLAIAAALFRMLLLRLTHSIGSAALSISVIFSFSESLFTMPSNSFCACNSTSTRWLFSAPAVSKL